MKIQNNKIIGLLISIFFIVLIFFQIDIKETLKAFKHINLMYFLLIIPVYYLSFIFRAFRWRLILSNDNLLKIKSLISALFIGYAANCLLPARMGEVYRAHLFGKKENLSRFKVFTSIVLERIFDGLVLFLILFSLIFLIYHKPFLFKLAYIVGSIFISGFLLLFIFAKIGKAKNLQNITESALKKIQSTFKIRANHFINKIVSGLSSLNEGLNIFNSSKLLSKSLLLTLIIWLMEGIVLFFIIKSFGIQLNPLSALFILGITTFSTMIPAGPASIGPYQYGYILALSIFGISKETALAVSIVNQMVIVFSVSIAGLIFIWKDHINIKEIENEIKKPIQYE